MDVTTSPTNLTLTFTALDWNSPQTVNIIAAEDDDIVQDTANLRHTASGGNYDDSAASTLTVTVRDNDAPLTFDTSTIPPFTFTVGQEVSSLPLPGATGGMPPLTYSLRPLLPGLDLHPMERTLTGTLSTVMATVTLTYTVTDSAPMPTTAALTFMVTVNPAPTLESISDPPIYLVGRTVLLMLPEASDGTAPFSYELTRPSGSPMLPSGLTFNEDARPPTITGTPAMGFGPASLRYTARDINMQTASQDFMLRVSIAVPVTPTGVSAVAGNERITVRWTALSGAATGGSAITAYIASATATEGGNNFICTANDATATSCTISSLANGTEYSVTVVARNSEGNSAPSIPIMATPAAAVFFRIKVFLEGAQ